MSQLTAPGPPARAGGINHLRAIRADFRTFSHATHQAHGDIVAYRVLGQSVYQFATPELAHEVLVGRARSLHKPDNHKRAFGRVIGNNLFTSDGADWIARRRLLSPVFLPQVIDRYRATVVRQASHVFDAAAEGEFDITRAASKIALLSVAEALFGAAINDVVDDILEVTGRLQGAVTRQILSPALVPLWIPTRDNRTVRSALRFFHDLMTPLIAERRRAPQGHDDLLAALLRATDGEGGTRLSDKEAIDEALTMLLAGSDTTAAALSWSSYLLATHPEIQQQLATQIAAPEHASGNGAPAPVPELAGQVFEETMRIYPPAVSIARQAVEPVEIGGVAIPAGALVFVSVYTIHHDERWFPDPERFDPERFATPPAHEIPDHAYLPFGIGPRACIGRRFALMEGAIVLTELLRRFSLHLTSPTQRPELETTLSLHPRGGLKLRVARR